MLRTEWTKLERNYKMLSMKIAAVLLKLPLTGPRLGMPSGRRR